MRCQVLQFFPWLLPSCQTCTKSSLWIPLEIFTQCYQHQTADNSSYYQSLFCPENRFPWSTFWTRLRKTTCLAIALVPLLVKKIEAVVGANITPGMRSANSGWRFRSSVIVWCFVLRRRKTSNMCQKTFFSAFPTPQSSAHTYFVFPLVTYF